MSYKSLADARLTIRSLKINEKFKELIQNAIDNVDSAIDKIETDDLGNDKNYIELNNIITRLESIIEE